MAKSVAKSASRALGFFICRDKALEGMPFECFSKCYNSLVQPVIDYGSSVWGTNGYSCVETTIPCLSLFSWTRVICSNPYSFRRHGMVNTLTQTMAWCNEKMAPGVVHGQLFLTKKIFYTP